MSERFIVCVVGSSGRMGTAVIEVLNELKPFGDNFEYMSVDQKKGTRKSIGDVDPEIVNVVINFTNPEATIESAKWCAENNVPLVTGTTGLSEAQRNELEIWSDDTPILWSPNMSLGVNLIDALLPQFAQVLQGFAIEIVEIHHDKKKDSPSGTAVRFANTLTKTIGGEVVYGRVKGMAENRPITDVVVHALRGGTIPGEHTIYFFGPDEVIEIKHRALSRKIFALGAIKAAKWIIDSGEEFGFYSMNDVLDL